MGNLESTDFGYFLGGLGLLSTVISLAFYSRSYLPGNQMKLLDELLQETRQIYEKSDAEDLLPNHLKTHFGARLARLERLREHYREQTYRAISVFDQYIALIRGVSVGIMNVSDGAKQLRARVVTTSEQTKRRREEESRATSEPPGTSPAILPVPAPLNVQDSTNLSTHESSDNEDHPSECRSTTPESDTSTLAQQPPSLNPSGDQRWSFLWKWRCFSFARTKCPNSDIESRMPPDRSPTATFS